MLQQIVERLETEHVQAGKQRQFQVLKGFLIGDHQGFTYGDAADTLGISPEAARQAVSRLRRRYRELLREEIGHTVTSPDEVEDEIRRLFTTLEN